MGLPSEEGTEEKPYLICRNYVDLHKTFVHQNVRSVRVYTGLQVKDLRNLPAGAKLFVNYGLANDLPKRTG